MTEREWADMLEKSMVEAKELSVTLPGKIASVYWFYIIQNGRPSRYSAGIRFAVSDKIEQFGGSGGTVWVRHSSFCRGKEITPKPAQLTFVEEIRGHRPFVCVG